MKNDDKKFIIGVTVLILIIISMLVVILVYLLPQEIQQHKLKNSYEELCFDIDEFEVDFEDDRDGYDVFADGKHYYIPRKQLEIIIDTQDTYIVLLISEYSDSYNKAYLVLNVKQEELENDK